MIAATVLCRPLARFITVERDRLLQHGRELTLEEQASLHAHFSPVDLARVRLVIGHAVHEPGFVPLVRRMGMAVPSTTLAEAVTLDYLIASSEPVRLGTLVHEIVHSVQYRLIGVPRFAFNYIHDFLVSGYEASPMEQAASELSQRFERGEIFDVEQEVRNRIRIR